MNILYIAPQKIISGASLSLIGMVRILSTRHKIYVIVEDINTEYAEQLRKEGAELFQCRMPKWLKYRPKSFFKWKLIRTKSKIAHLIADFEMYRLIKKISYLNIDIVHSNLRISNLGAKLACKLGVPHIWHIREFGEEDFDLYPIYSERYTYNFMNKYGNKLIVISDELKCKFSPIFGDKVIKISNGIDVKLFKYENREKWDDNCIVLGMTSIVSRTKGQKEFLLAISQLPDNVKKRIKVKIAGACYDAKFEDELHDIIIQNELTEIVEFLGHVNDIASLLKKIDILIVASHNEAFGRVTVEGMMAGCLIIGANSGGTREILSGGKYGLLYTVGDVDALSDQIAKAIINCKQMYELALLGQEKACEFYTDEKNANEIEKLYFELVKK